MCVAHFSIIAGVTLLLISEIKLARVPPTASIADMYFVLATIGLLVAIIVVGLLLFLMLRKR
jgi:hypothetical protein